MLEQRHFTCIHCIALQQREQNTPVHMWSFFQLNVKSPPVGGGRYKRPPPGAPRCAGRATVSFTSPVYTAWSNPSTGPCPSIICASKAFSYSMVFAALAFVHFGKISRAMRSATKRPSPSRGERPASTASPSVRTKFRYQQQPAACLAGPVSGRWMPTPKTQPRHALEPLGERAGCERTIMALVHAVPCNAGGAITGGLVPISHAIARRAFFF